MGKLEFRYGTMNSGKSMLLLKTAYNYEENGKKVTLIKPKTDTKGKDYLISRTGLRRKVQINLAQQESLEAKNYQKMITESDIILVDEAQFLTKHQVEELWKITTEKNIPIICFGLKTNFKSELFEGSKRLLELADTIEELETICACGRKAKFNARKYQDRFLIEGEECIIDGSDDKIKYIPLCSKCYFKKVYALNQNEKNKY